MILKTYLEEEKPLKIPGIFQEITYDALAGDKLLDIVCSTCSTAHYSLLVINIIAFRVGILSRFKWIALYHPH